MDGVTTGPAPGFLKNPAKLLELVPSPRRVRVDFNGECVADTTNALVMREGGHTPVYYFPKADVRMDLFSPTDHATNCPYKGDASYWNVTVAGVTGENVMWGYETPYDEMAELSDYVAFYWERMERWREEEEEIFKHARDPFKRVDAILSHRPVKCVLGGEVVAETTDGVFVFETGHPVRYYIPRADVKMDLLSRTETESVCPYKGTATYFSARIGGELFDDIAWSYEHPIAECPRIRDLICFYAENIDATFVDGVEVEKPETKWKK